MTDRITVKMRLTKLEFRMPTYKTDGSVRTPQHAKLELSCDPAQGRKLPELMIDADGGVMNLQLSGKDVETWKGFGRIRKVPITGSKGDDAGGTMQAEVFIAESDLPDLARFFIDVVEHSTITVKAGVLQQRFEFEAEAGEPEPESPGQGNLEDA